MKNRRAAFAGLAVKSTYIDFRIMEFVDHPPDISDVG